VRGVLSVAVLSESGTAGDALDNVFYVRGVERARSYLKRLSRTEVLFFLPDKRAKWRLARL
jgi:thiamine biosynthesis lipoprotein ApbE